MIKSHTGCYAWVAFLVGSGRKLRPVVVHTDSRFRYAALLRYCTDYAFGFSMLDETGFYAPSVAHNAFPSRPWLRISVLHGHNPTVSKQLRYALSRESVCTRQAGLTALTLWWNSLRRELRVAHCCNRQRFYLRLASTRLRWDKIRKD